LTMNQCTSIYYGSEQDWRCKLEAGHTGSHAADKRVKVNIKPHEENRYKSYCAWNEEDSTESMIRSLSDKLGGN
jgi:hypothetical protein